MENKLVQAISELSLRMRLIKSMQEEKSSSSNLTDRDMLLLEMVDKAGAMTVSQIAAVHPNVSESTISEYWNLSDYCEYVNWHCNRID